MGRYYEHILWNISTFTYLNDLNREKEEMKGERGKNLVEQVLTRFWNPNACCKFINFSQSHIDYFIHAEYFKARFLAMILSKIIMNYCEE